MAVEKKSLISKSTNPSTKNIMTAPVASPKLQPAARLGKQVLAKQVLAKQVLAMQVLAKQVLAKQVLAKRAIG